MYATRYVNLREKFDLQDEKNYYACMHALQRMLL